MSTNQTISFGKYKGQPLTILLKDKPYLKWCQQQSWFQEKFPELCDISLTENTQAPMNKSVSVKPIIVKPAVVAESIHVKIKRLEEENDIMMQKIKHNQEEIQHLRANTTDDSDEDDTDKPPIKRVGKCML